MSTILLTGGSGMLGQAIQRLNETHIIKAPNSSELDLKDNHSLRNYLSKEKISTIIHAAAKVGGIKANIDNQELFYAKNTRINLNLIEEAKSAGIKNLINIGSSCMYPKNIEEPIKEKDLLSAPLEPTNEGYALAKITATQHCNYISKQYNYNYKTIIPCNMYGPGDNYNPDTSHLMAAIILKIHNAIKNKDQTIEIWGDGTARRELIYVDDLANFILEKVEQLEKLPPSLNLGLNQDFTVTEYYQMVAEVLNYNGEFSYNLSKPVGMKQKLMDSSKAKALGWNAKTSFEEGIATSYRDFTKSLLSSA